MPFKDLEETGYNEEEHYFKVHDAELIDVLKQKRRELNETRQSVKGKSRQAEHWMRCPKCGGEMQETIIEGVYIDRCAECEGVYLDKGELELLLEYHEKSSGVIHKLKQLFHVGS